MKEVGNGAECKPNKRFWEGGRNEVKNQLVDDLVLDVAINRGRNDKSSVTACAKTSS